MEIKKLSIITENNLINCQMFCVANIEEILSENLLSSLGNTSVTRVLLSWAHQPELFY